MKLRSFTTNFLVNEEGAIVQWLLVLIACSILCVIIFSNLKPGIETSTGKMHNALTGD